MLSGGWDEVGLYAVILFVFVFLLSMVTQHAALQYFQSWQGYPDKEYSKSECEPSLQFHCHEFDSL